MIEDRLFITTHIDCIVKLYIGLIQENKNNDFIFLCKNSTLEHFFKNISKFEQNFNFGALLSMNLWTNCINMAKFIAMQQ